MNAKPKAPAVEIRCACGARQAFYGWTLTNLYQLSRSEGTADPILDAWLDGKCPECGKDKEKP